MKSIIEPVDKELILKEFNEDRFLRATNKGGNEIYVITATDSPNAMQEIGRLREISFRNGGGGTGEEVDIDDEDMAVGGYRQLVVWDPEAEEIVGGYRYILSDGKHPKHMSTEHYFTFSELMRNDFLPYSIELGRSFVQPHYQGVTINRKGLYALDNLWDGLGALVAFNPEMKYFLGKITMYSGFNRKARSALFYFMYKYFPDPDQLMIPNDPLFIDLEEDKNRELFTGENYQEDYKILNREIRSLGENIPPLFNSYMNLSPTMRVFGTFVNSDFGNVEETGIMVSIEDIYSEKSERHIKSMLQNE